MFQFIRRVSASLLPRPDRPWRDDATSHAPTIGRKRRYSDTEQDDNDSPSSTAKKSKNDLVKPDTECDSASEGESPKGDAVPPVEGREVKAVTKGVKEVDLEDKDKVDDASLIQPEGVPLPDSPSGSPEPESESPEPTQSDTVEETKDQEHADDKDSVASSALEDGVEEEAEADPVTANTDAPVDGTAPAQEVPITTVDSSAHDILETLEAKA
ncbi:hypothetical protein J3R82DRAFT_8017 [Butyriboletus roseoflavus]|nr:hypothetical protein J3R82DRAFT_8017 [Butyriboletus roseoflavus]